MFIKNIVIYSTSFFIYFDINYLPIKNTSHRPSEEYDPDRGIRTLQTWRQVQSYIYGLCYGHHGLTD